MILAYWCVLIAAFMPVGLVGYAKFSGRRKLGPDDNRRPRQWLEQTEGAQQRAYWAQLNSFEAFPPFAAGVIIAVIAGGSITAINIFAVLFVLLRQGSVAVPCNAELRKNGHRPSGLQRGAAWSGNRP